MGEKPRVVFDTNILISALGWGGKPEECLQHVLQDRIDGYTSPEIIDELTRVMEYPRFEFTEDEKQRFLEIVLLQFHLVNSEVSLDVVEDDSDDNTIIECAVAGDADYIVSGDSHLLDLESFQEIDILAPAELLKRLQDQGE